MNICKSTVVPMAGLVLALQGCATVPHNDEVLQASSNTADDTLVGNGPALWKVADDDTTVYLFGTVHALPEGKDWYNEPIATALGSAGELVTEIPVAAMDDPASQQIIASKAMLPPGQSLRTILSEDDRASYEAALGSLGMPPAAFDSFEPWFAGMTLSVLPLLQKGWTPESGVEKVVEKSAPTTAKRSALETMEYQIGIFDELPEQSQIDFLMFAANNIDRMVPMMDLMVAEWLEGDADDLAELMNQGLTDPALAHALLYSRNEKWAEWIDARMDEPGTVFVAVGAGHLAGEKSVQDYLEARGFSVARIQ